jgi:hypothetical protein
VLLNPYRLKKKCCPPPHPIWSRVRPSYPSIFSLPPIYPSYPCVITEPLLTFLPLHCLSCLDVVCAYQDYWYHMKNEHLLVSMARADRMGPFGLSGRRAVFFATHM